MKNLTLDEKKNLANIYFLLDIHFRFLHTLITQGIPEEEYSSINSDYMELHDDILSWIFNYMYISNRSIPNITLLEKTSVSDVYTALTSNDALKILQEEFTCLEYIADIVSPKDRTAFLSEDVASPFNYSTISTYHPKHQPIANPNIYSLSFNKNTAKLVLNDTFIIYSTKFDLRIYQTFSDAFNKTNTDDKKSDRKGAFTYMHPIITHVKLPEKLKKLFFQKSKTSFKVCRTITAEMLREANIDFYEVNRELLKLHK